MADANEKKDPATEEAPQYLTSEAANSMMNAHLKRHSVQMEKMFQSMFAPILEKMNTPAAEPAKEGQTETDRKLAETLRRLEAAEARAKESETKRVEQESARLREEEHSALERSLRAGGVTNEISVKAARALLREENAYFRDSENKLKFRLKKNGYEDEKELDEGVKEWLGSDAGKNFLPPTGATGAETRPGKGQAPAAAPGPMNREKARDVLNQFLRSR
jgi:hypothetical protein